MEEEWKDVVGYEGLYQVSNLGRVRSLDYRRTGRIQLLKPAMHRDGYLYVNLCKDRKRKHYKVHRLVAQAYLPNPEVLPELNHIDENKQNNCVDNLEWCERQHNCNYGTRNARIAAAKTNGKCSKPVQQLTKDGTLVAVWTSIHEAERVTGNSKGNICRCCRGKRPTAGGFIWHYAQ